MSEKHNLPRNVKLNAICNLLRKAPPGEFPNVFSDVRLLADDDSVMHEQAAKSWALHNKDNFTPVEQDGGVVLLTRHNDLGNSRFFDPDKKVSFHYSHLHREAGDFQPYPVEREMDESWRNAFQESLRGYVSSHYSPGNCSVYRKPLHGKNLIVACIEGHQFNPSAFWNGLWRSEWIFDLTPPVTKVMGNIMVQAHYYEDGNIHLTASKSVDDTLFLNSKAEAAKDFAHLVENAESQFQAALMEEYNNLSDATLKGIRRQLPVTRSILDWNKILTSKVLEAKLVQ